MQQPVADGVYDGGLADKVMPLLSRVLTGDDGGGLSMAILDDLQEIFSFRVRQGGDEQVIEDEQLDFGEPGESFQVSAIAFSLQQGFKESWRSKIKDAVT